MAKTPVSAFEKGEAAAREGDPVNPFPEGTPEHNNFEVGRRFGLQRLRGRDALAQSGLARS